ncbi:hypothetical protein [Actinomadura sp. 6N118]|uniref:hypothetical protein n=1 Tax=Actinomadura sp. 6N118 TaxID=3375151 RepID=UPI00378FE158
MASDLWLRRYHPAPGVQLVCFPHAGGSASFVHGRRLKPGEACAKAVPLTLTILALTYGGLHEAMRLDTGLETVFGTEMADEQPPGLGIDDLRGASAGNCLWALTVVACGRPGRRGLATRLDERNEHP